MLFKSKASAFKTPASNSLSIITKSKPWLTDDSIPLEIDTPIGMVGPEERRSYYWFAKHALTDNGCIVDAGAFLGASGYCLAAGAAASGRRRFKGGPVVHSYDYFSVVDEYVRQSISEQVRPIGMGESYLDIFKKQTEPFTDMIESHGGDFLEHSWNGNPIDLLFIDISKTAALNAHVCNEFIPSMVPGRSVMIHQDYFHCWHPYIHISAEFLSDELELLDDHIPHQSAAWMLKKPISAEKLQRLAKYDFSAQERIQILDKLIGKSSKEVKPMIECVKLWQHYEDGDLDLAKRQLTRLDALYGINGLVGAKLWARQAREIKALMENKKEEQVEKDAKKIVGPVSPVAQLLVRSASLEISEINSNVSFDKIIANYPSFHRDEKGEPWFLGVSGDTLKVLASFIKPGMRTVETGAGFSSLAFIIKGSQHTAICPDDYLEKNIREWCDKWKINHSRFTYKMAKSQDVVPFMTEDLDFVFIDGEHAFPLPQIDFYYLARRLKVGGHLAIDDTNLWTGAILVQNLRCDKDWVFVSEHGGKTAIFRRLTPFRDHGLGDQPFVIANSLGLPSSFYDSMMRR